MSMLDAFFNKGFKAAKCKTLLKLTIPRIKLLRNRREIQIRQMRRDIAKLLETGQEATARIRVEHIIREENMMAAQEIIALFCELISVRIPIIETQRECPLDLKEAISSVCFSAPRCADLPELLHVQMLFSSKYGKEFVAAATELRPDCGVNRQLIELLSVCAPSAETKLKLLKEIAEQHEIDWDPAASETEFLKPHEDLLVSENTTALLMLPIPASFISLLCQNGPTQFVSESKLPLPKEKHDETLYSSPVQASDEKTDSDSDFDVLEFPEVPQGSLRPSTVSAAPEIVHPNKSSQHLEPNNFPSEKPYVERDKAVPERSVAHEDGTAAAQAMGGNKQFLPFIAPPSLSYSASQNSPPPSLREKSDANVDLQDVLASAQAAAENAERAAAAARSAASLAQLRISELTRRREDQVPETSPFSTATGSADPSTSMEKPYVGHQNSMDSSDGDMHSPEVQQLSESLNAAFDSSPIDNDVYWHQPQRLSSMDDNSYFSHPNLFTSQNSHAGIGTKSFAENFQSDLVFDPEHPRHEPQRLPSMDSDFSLFTSQDSFSDNLRSTHHV